MVSSRSGYVRDVGIKDGMAAADLRTLVAAGLLEAHGQTKAALTARLPP